MHKARRAALGLMASAALSAALPALAQEKYPTRPITFIVPFPPGGPTDAMARILATELSRELGQSVIVQNKAGAGGNIGADYVARARPDGYTLMFGTSGPLAINKPLYRSISYDPRTSFTPIIYVGYLPNVLVVRPDLGVGNVRELIALEKSKPGKLNFASSGNGASSHLAGVLFNGLAGTQLQHVPYRGTGPALNDLLAGQVDMTFTDILTAMPYIKAGKVKALGVATAKRSSAMPRIPTIAEQGLAGYDVSVFFGVVGPKGMPAERVEMLNQAYAKSLDSESVKNAFAAQGLERGTDVKPAYLAGLVKSELDRWSEVVRKAGVTLD
ncbi:MAG: tripartite tricarboxylate transporter substrate binding protein [Comamonas sp.]|jgi:tripartite-type tricarboxylate transporter receptor subunit TctC|uniref:Bug family tripartite tricarboxylate transporter substrate binding protein n=1 Tax=Comamonas sp. TaxID=34028 RepID=UPI00283FD478|nr:tripartite tricarboxylate transporter substrate binding protein [Comamonas sp.]MDR3064653.1 tripartite tricarboxylate transporter substrate binding protein [Comamonas sp.]